MTSSLKRRIALLAVGPVAGVAGYFYLEAVADDLEGSLASDMGGAANWLAVCSALFVVNYAIAWHHRASWPVTMGRLLVWGLGAYLCISNLVDLFGQNREAVWQVFGAEGPAGEAEIAFLRGSVLGWGLCLAMSITAIAVGFEREAPSEPGREDEDQSESSDM